MNQEHPTVFYGWWIVIACFFMSSLIAGFVALGFTAFFEPIANEFGWSYAQISLAASMQGAEAGLLAPLLGLLTDRWGPRRIVFISGIIVGLGLILLSRTTSLAMFYIAFAILSMGYSGFGPTVMMTAVANWFHRKVGLTVGIMVSGFACGGLFIPLVAKLIDAYDWRQAILILTMITWIVGLPLSLVLRHKPEQYGYLPDGDSTRSTKDSFTQESRQTDKVNVGIKEVLKDGIFWRIGLAMSCQYLAINAVNLHVMPYLSSVGIMRTTSSVIAAAIPLVSIAGRLGSGWLGDRFPKKWVVVGGFAVTSLGLLSFSYTSSENFWLLIPFIVLYGIGWGGNVTMRAALLNEYFGRARFGSILGFVMGLIAVGSVLGPFLAGLVFDQWDSYRYAWLASSALCIAALFVIATMPRVSTSS